MPSLDKKCLQKSVKSKKLNPKIWNSDIRLKDKALNMPKVHAKLPSKIAALSLFIFQDSTNQATLGSKREIDELNAAMLRRIKNIIPNKDPIGIELKAKGRV